VTALATCSCPSITIQLSKSLEEFAFCETNPFAIRNCRTAQVNVCSVTDVHFCLSATGILRNEAKLRNEVVGLGRVELPTSPLSGVRSNQLSYRPVIFQRWAWVDSNYHASPSSGVRVILISPYGEGHLSYRWKTGGAGRDRTGDLLNANQALSQLSYSPCIRDVIEADWTRPLMTSINGLK
jgi:hypothetical protein